MKFVSNIGFVTQDTNQYLLVDDWSIRFSNPDRYLQLNIELYSRTQFAIQNFICNKRKPDWSFRDMMFVVNSYNSEKW